VPNVGVEESLDVWRTRALELERAIAGIVIGQERAIRLLTIAVFARGDVLLEGNVGVGKTVLLRGFARAIGGAYERIEGTVDLMPADLVCYTYVDERGSPRVAPGPLLKHGEALSIFFFNEVNRARPQLHSLLLRVMAERSVTAFNREYHFPHLQIVADRNRVEKEETFELPAAARDRFLMEIAIEAPVERELQRTLMFDPRFHDATLAAGLGAPRRDPPRKLTLGAMRRNMGGVQLMSRFMARCTSEPMFIPPSQEAGLSNVRSRRESMR